MTKEITIGGLGYLPCLSCGELIKLDGEMHLCNATKNKWLDKMDSAIIQMPDGNLFDIKNKVIIKKNKMRGILK